MHALWHTLQKAVEAEGRAVLVSVLAVEGSAPREAGARMIVTPAGIRGTIGGGALEHEAWEKAMRLLAQDKPQAFLSRHALGPDLGQCCGGRVELGFEHFDSRAVGTLSQWVLDSGKGTLVQAEFAKGPHAIRRALLETGISLPIEKRGETLFVERCDERRQNLHLFGAGHVGKALVLALAPLPFKIAWYDPRETMFPAFMPAHAEPKRLDDPDALPFASDDFVLIMTHSHPLDLALVATALRSPAHFIGLIGSETKKMRFQSRLRAAGFSPDSMARLVCPIGVEGISGKEPAMIAASVTAQLLIVREQALSKEQRPETPLDRRVAMGGRS
jgi:xanthine dehydrogenase accessory factor